MTSVDTSSPTAFSRVPAMKKRSISSAIMNLFKNNTSSDEIDAGIQNKGVNKKARLASSNILGSRVADKGSVILYESENNERPPVLPILPVQRLRLLRQKQKLRYQSERRILSSIGNVTLNSDQNHMDQLDNANDTVIFHKSSTPSPIKTHQNDQNHSLSSIKLKSLGTKKNKTNKLIGTKWSGLYEYDVSDYTNTEKDKLFDSDTIIAQDTNSISNNNKIENKISISTLIANDKTSNLVSTNELTSTQRNLLINGSKNTSDNTKDKFSMENTLSQNAPKITLSPVVSKETMKANPTILLPTVGFDFIKNNDTPSKTSSPLGKSIPLHKSSTANYESKQPAFSFDGSSTYKTTEKKELPKLGFNLPKSNESLISTPSPSTLNKPLLFNQKTLSSHESDDNNDEDEPRRKKRSNAGVTVDMTKDVNKPTFSFGSIADAPPAHIKPSFSFGAPASKATTEKPETKTPSFTFGANSATEASKAETDKAKSSFSFGTPKAADLKDDTTANKPSFSFGLPATTKKDNPSTSSSVPSFTLPKITDNKSIVGEAKPTLPPFSFGKLSGTVEAPAAASAPSLGFSFSKPSDAQKPTSDDAAALKSSFSFGAPQPATTTTTDDKSVKPNFSFGQSPASSAGNTPAPSLFSNASNITNTTNNPLVSGQVGAAASKPSFSFGQKPQDSNLPSGPASNTSSSGFNFTRAPVANTGATTPSTGGFGSNPLLGTNNAGAKLPSTTPPLAGFSFGKSSVPTQTNTANPLLSSSSNTMGNNPNPLLSGGINNGSSAFSFGGDNNAQKPSSGGSVFQMNSGMNNTSQGMGAMSATPQNFFGNNNNNINQQQQQPVFNPSMTANVNFGSAKTLDPAAVFGSQPQQAQPQQMFNQQMNMGMTTTNNGLTPQPGAMTQRKLARMRGSRR